MKASTKRMALKAVENNGFMTRQVEKSKKMFPWASKFPYSLGERWSCFIVLETYGHLVLLRKVFVQDYSNLLLLPSAHGTTMTYAIISALAFHT